MSKKIKPQMTILHQRFSIYNSKKNIILLVPNRAMSDDKPLGVYAIEQLAVQFFGVPVLFLSLKTE
ncbi:hypothetical protein VF14_23840 [Nostoc linckia z18]|uniref:Uncharacterized protein n=2 Tax=Nostoc linckia TaxID=92942 RepID=A0A9Q6EJI9_NOSLI|nr:hypothetical protein VF02_20830 [Nostoc linckia z1]PHJ64832.1 hypothetical protein VF05_22035 [Nostoc linckia z3]PHJ76341.1 hypothetical protein VF03_07590 [Nostoc linckia z2]PHJ83209.1 hypothetical protein VF06_13935 [Nostoc linckia z4]PHJ90158.1 hypothetical protein VF07_09490 [Nostoc linckia z6]PHJ99691.1 hypothetical protein VF04_05815 [Nostoc linckia z7]PHK00385.1 hypothetical protein VF08_24335 [Nostoc linckia z8]PHK04773.1 hypothetical protein VF09_27910 [Nostoc linckia z9]PHK1818